MNRAEFKSSANISCVLMMMMLMTMIMIMIMLMMMMMMMMTAHVISMIKEVRAQETTIKSMQFHISRM